MHEAGAPLPEIQLLRGGTLRTEPADFAVDEVPQYTPCGSGEHLYLRVEKTGMTTPAMVDRVARALGVHPREVGCAGLKDRHAVTRQWISVPRVEAAQALALDLPGLRVLEAQRHGNKLRTGHLAGNRFDILVRGVDSAVAAPLHEALQRLMLEGLPNPYGVQRYGARGDNAALGTALVHKDHAALLHLLCTAVPSRESPRVIEARAALAARDSARALQLFPREFDLERHFAEAWHRGLDDAAAFERLPQQPVHFLINAWQSALFDAVLHARLALGSDILTGDVAMKTTNGASFVVEDAAVDAPRRTAFEIVPTGPLPGSKLLRPAGAVRTLEDDALRAAGCDPDNCDALPLPGARRALIVRVQEASATAEAAGVRLRFTLPAGSFATTLLAMFGVDTAARPPEKPASGGTS